MKALIILMLTLSVFVQIHTDIYGLVALYHIEFLEPVSIIQSGNYNTLMLILWLALLFSHLSLVSLLFLTKKAYFRDLLIWVPLSFILIFILNSFLSFFLLIPFIVVWVIALIKQGRKSSLALK